MEKASVLIENLKQYLSSDKGKKLIFFFSLSILVFCACLSFYHTFINAVDIPFDDEFDLFINPDMTKDFNLYWIFTPQGEAKIVLTRLLSWIFYRINNYNCTSIIIFNFFLSCLGYFVLYKTLKSVAKDFAWLPLFFVPFFSDIFWMNRLISFQSQVYFMLLFSYLAIYYGLVKDKILTSSIFCFLATISQHFIAPLPIFIVCCIKEIKTRKLQSIKTLLIPTLIITLGIMYNLRGFSGPIDQNWSGYIYPNTLFFYKLASHLAIRGIVITRLDTSITIFASIIAIFALIVAISRIKLYKSKNLYPIYAILATYFSFVLADTVARGGFGYGILPWHFDFFVYIIPTIAVAFYALGLKKELFVYSIVLLFFHTPHFTQGYQTFKEFGDANKINAECIYKAVNGQNNNICEGVYYSKDMTKVLNSAKKLNINFVQTARKHKKQSIEK